MEEDLLHGVLTTYGQISVLHIICLLSAVEGGVTCCLLAIYRWWSSNRMVYLACRQKQHVLNQVHFR